MRERGLPAIHPVCGQDDGSQANESETAKHADAVLLKDYSLAVPPLPPGMMPKAEVKDCQSGREIVGTNLRQVFSIP